MPLCQAFLPAGRKSAAQRAALFKIPIRPSGSRTRSLPFGEFAVVVGNVVLVVIVLDRGLDGFLRQHGAVELVRGQTAEGVDDLLIGQRQRVFERAALDHLGGDGARCDRAAAAEGLKFDVFDPVVLDLQVHLHDVAALGVADLADAVRVRDLADIARVHEMIHDGLGIKCHNERLLTA